MKKKKKKDKELIYDDGQSAKAVAKNTVQNDSTKHIDIEYFVVGEQVQERENVPKHFNTNGMLVDVLTNILLKEKLQFV